MILASSVAGYDVLLPYQEHNAADYGVPQDRRRLFLIGTKRGLKAPVYPVSLRQRCTVWQAIGDLSDPEPFEELRSSDAIHTEWPTKGVYARKLRGLDADLEDYGYYDMSGATRHFMVPRHTIAQRTRKSAENSTQATAQAHRLRRNLNIHLNFFQSGTHRVFTQFRAYLFFDLECIY